MLARHDGGLDQIVVRFGIVLHIEPIFPGGLNVGGKDNSMAVAFKVWTSNQQHLRTCYKFEFLDLSPSLQNQKLDAGAPAILYF